MGKSKGQKDPVRKNSPSWWQICRNVQESTRLLHRKLELIKNLLRINKKLALE